jgi:NADH:ubiquinone reductase (non-electrogenic)
VACKDVDLDGKKVICTTGGADATDLTLDYDHLVVAVGAQPNTFGIPGVDKYAKFLKEMEHGRELRRHLLNRLEEADVAFATGNIDKVKQLLSIVVVGGGPTGVEFCGELTDLIKRDLNKRFPNLKEHFQVTLVEALPGLLTMFQKAVGEHVKDHLVSQGVDVRLNAAVKEAQEDKVQIKRKDGSVDTLDYGTLVWVAGVGMRPFTKALCTKIGPEAGQTDRRGLVVDGCLRVKGTRLGEVFAMGDCAISGKPPTAQVATQQGKYLGRMFRYGNDSLITDDTAPPFTYHHQGTMAYVGDSAAATELFPAGMLKLGQGSISDHLWWRSLYGEVDHFRVMGFAGFAVWRSVYFSKMFSSRGRWCVGSDWLRTTFYGRPASSSAQGTHDSVFLA